ncbi:hypothetical protein D3C72_1909370 [compost metagenome]
MRRLDVATSLVACGRRAPYAAVLPPSNGTITPFGQLVSGAQNLPGPVRFALRNGKPGANAVREARRSIDRCQSATTWRAVLVSLLAHLIRLYCYGLFPCGLKDREKVIDYGDRPQVPAADVAPCQK